jgi:hypothetical protein
VRDIQKSSIIRSAQTTLRGMKRKFSMVKGAQTKSGGHEEKNPKSPKDLSFPK